MNVLKVSKKRNNGYAKAEAEVTMIKLQSNISSEIISIVTKRQWRFCFAKEMLRATFRRRFDRERTSRAWGTRRPFGKTLYANASGASLASVWLTRSCSQLPLFPYRSRAQWRIVNAVKVTHVRHGPGPVILVRVLPLFFLEYTRGPRGTIFTPVAISFQWQRSLAVVVVVVRYKLYRFHAIADGPDRSCPILSRFLPRVYLSSRDYTLRCGQFSRAVSQNCNNPAERTTYARAHVSAYIVTLCFAEITIWTY